MSIYIYIYSLKCVCLYYFTPPEFFTIVLTSSFSLRPMTVNLLRIPVHFAIIIIIIINIIIIIIPLLAIFSHQCQHVVFHRSLSGNKVSSLCKSCYYYYLLIRVYHSSII